MNKIWKWKFKYVNTPFLPCTHAVPMQSDKTSSFKQLSQLNIAALAAEIYFLKGSPGMASIHSLNEHVCTCCVHGTIHKDKKKKNTVLAIQQLIVWLER